MKDPFYFLLQPGFIHIGQLHVGFQSLLFIDRDTVSLDTTAVKVAGGIPEWSFDLLFEEFLRDEGPEDYPDVLGEFIADGTGPHRVPVSMGSQIIDNLHWVYQWIIGRPTPHLYPLSLSSITSMQAGWRLEPLHEGFKGLKFGHLERRQRTVLDGEFPEMSDSGDRGMNVLRGV